MGTPSWSCSGSGRFFFGEAAAVTPRDRLPPLSGVNELPPGCAAWAPGSWRAGSVSSRLLAGLPFSGSTENSRREARPPSAPGPCLCLEQHSSALCPKRVPGHDRPTPNIHTPGAESGAGAGPRETLPILPAPLSTSTGRPGLLAPPARGGFPAPLPEPLEAGPLDPCPSRPAPASEAQRAIEGQPQIWGAAAQVHGPSPRCPWQGAQGWTPSVCAKVSLVSATASCSPVPGVCPGPCSEWKGSGPLCQDDSGAAGHPASLSSAAPSPPLSPPPSPHA